VKEKNLDPFFQSADHESRPASRAFAITPDNNNDLSQNARSLFINTGGDVVLLAVDNEDAETVIFSVPDQFILPVRTRRVLTTGTTATGIIGLV